MSQKLEFRMSSYQLSAVSVQQDKAKNLEAIFDRTQGGDLVP
jgi:hypothetical protein